MLLLYNMYVKFTYYRINCVSANCTYNSAECTLKYVIPSVHTRSVLDQYVLEYYMRATFPLRQLFFDLYCSTIVLLKSTVEYHLIKV